MKLKRAHTHDIEQGNNHGFTLLEILIAIVILSVGLLGMASLTIGIINGNKFSNNVTTATTLAQDKIEAIRATPFLNVASEAKSVLAAPYSEFKREVVVVAGPGAGMKTVTVRVYWGGASMEDHHVELKTIIAQ